MKAPRRRAADRASLDAQFRLDSRRKTAAAAAKPKESAMKKNAKENGTFPANAKRQRSRLRSARSESGKEKVQFFKRRTVLDITDSTLNVPSNVQIFLLALFGAKCNSSLRTVNRDFLKKREYFVNSY